MRIGLALLAVLAPACATRPAEFDPEDLEFLEQPIVEVVELEHGIATLGLGLSARSYAILPGVSPEPAGLLAFAKANLATGEPVHATVLVLDRSPKQPPRGTDEPRWPFVILRLDESPDPREAERDRRP